MIVELHLIQNFAPSNLNRDDTNNPKDCEFGGYRRARISSQCFKRAVRHDPVFAQTTGVPTSWRTNKIKSELIHQMMAQGIDSETATAHAEEFAKNYSSKKAKMDGDQTLVLLFLSRAEVEEIATSLVNMAEAGAIKKYAEDFAKTTRNRPSAPDIALFGRMLADRPETNIDAACQVAHAISTHAVNMDMDYFTAVDDLQPKETTGASMLGLSGFNSSCFYRYACLDFNQLVTNLGGDLAMARKTVEAFLRSSVHAVPTGKQNSTAAQNPPSFFMTVVRDDGCAWSLANAFEKPVSVGENGWVYASIRALDQYWGRLASFFNTQAHPVVTALDGNAVLTHLKPAYVDNLEAWIQETLAQLPRE